MSEEYTEVAATPSPPNSSMAVVSLVAGILGLTFFPIIGAIVAVITGPMAKKEIRESEGTLGGEGMATAGIILGWIGIGIMVFGLCIACILAATVSSLLVPLSREIFSQLLPTLLAI